MTLGIQLRNYLCAETGIVALVFRVLQGERLVVWKRTFYEHSIPSPWQWQALPSPLLLLPTSCKEFKRRSPPGLLLGASAPLCYPVQSSWLTFNSKASVKRAKEHKMCLATGVHTGHSLSHTSVSIRCRGPLSLQVHSAVRWAGIKAQSPRVYGQTLWCSDTDVKYISYYQQHAPASCPSFTLHFKKPKYQRLPFLWLCTAGLRHLMCALVYNSVILNYYCPVFLGLMTFIGVSFFTTIYLLYLLSIEAFSRVTPLLLCFL